MKFRTVATLLAVLLAIGLSGTTFAGDKAGGVNVTSGDCEDLQVNALSGYVYVFLQIPNAVDYTWTLTFHKTGTFYEGDLLGDGFCSLGNWTLYATGQFVTDTGAATFQVFDATGKKVGGDSFRGIVED